MNRYESITLDDIKFDKEDALLFSYDDDLLLKARAIQNSILPKLDALLCLSLNKIESIYGVSVYDENSHFVYSPHFREKRENNLKLNYSESTAGISGSRVPVWKGLSRDDRKEVKIIPIHIQYEFSKNGLILVFYIDNRIDLSLESFRKIFSFLYENIDDIQTIATVFGFEIETGYLEEILTPIKKRLQRILDSNNKDDYFFYITKKYDLPFYGKNERIILDDFASLFPIYYEMLLIAQEKTSRFEPLEDRFRKYVLANIQKENSRDDVQDVVKECKKVNDGKRVKALAEKSVDAIGIRVGVRWQVFERDNFKCVACGASAKDGAILHVDHIVPRSKGGCDAMDNYQTLCQKCNIGKSNRSNRNLRL
ncbi:MAG: HNH endonuclease [Treponema sp.]|nr:HNH endonuclease [Treponema sp.]